MSFPQTPEEFENIYNNGNSVKINMINTDEDVPVGWEQYAKKVETTDDKQVEYIMIYKIE